MNAVPQAPEWSPSSWTSRPAQQQPSYKDPVAVMRAVDALGRLPPIVVSWEVDALKRQKLEGVKRRLVGFKVLEPKAVARHGYPVFLGGRPVDVVRSGTVTPTANAAIGTTYLPVEQAQPGTRFEIDVRGKRKVACIVKRPLYSPRVRDSV